MFIIDTNILVSAHRTDFPESKPVGFWKWLVRLGEQGLICIPESVYNEVGRSNDFLSTWLDKHKEKFWHSITESYASIETVMQAYEFISGKTIPVEELESGWADPYVIAHAKYLNGIVVTNESVNIGYPQNFHNIRIPTVCKNLNIRYLSLASFMWKMRSTLPI